MMPWWFDTCAGAMAFAAWHPFPWLWAVGCALIAGLLAYLDYADSEDEL